MVSNWHWETLFSGKLHQHSLKTPNDVSELDPEVGAGLPHALQSPCHFSIRDCGGWRWCNWSHWIKSLLPAPSWPCTDCGPSRKTETSCAPTACGPHKPMPLVCTHWNSHPHTQQCCAQAFWTQTGQTRKHETGCNSWRFNIQFCLLIWEKQKQKSRLQTWQTLAFTIKKENLQNYCFL